MSFKSIYFPKLKRRPQYSYYRRFNQYRQEIREDCQGRCIFCDTHENEVGGEEYMTLDHFRPKDKYADLKDQPTNLAWACSVCNNLKDNTWPAYGTPNTVIGNKGFIDPFQDNLNDYFDVQPDGEFKALQAPARWIIDTLTLNRSGVKKIRENRNNKYARKQQIKAFYSSAINDIDILLENTTISTSDRQLLLVHKQNLEIQQEVNIKNCELDFDLH